MDAIVNSCVGGFGYSPSNFYVLQIFKSHCILHDCTIKGVEPCFSSKFKDGMTLIIRKYLKLNENNLIHEVGLYYCY